MVKIPEMPGSYEPGDVVNGHILTPRGNWVPLGDPRAAGLRPRYLDQGVSTVRDPSSPAPEAPTTMSASTSGVHPPGYGASYGDDEPHPHSHGPTGDPSAPDNPYLRAVETARASGPNPAATRTGCIISLVVLAVVVLVFAAVISFIVRAANVVQDGFEGIGSTAGPALGEELELEGVEDDPFAIPSFDSPFLDDEEAALIEVTSTDWVSFESSTWLVAYLEAPELDRASVMLTVDFTAVDAEGATHETFDFLNLKPGQQNVAVAQVPGLFAGEIVELEARVTPRIASDDPAPYAVEVADWELDNETFRPTFRGTLEAGRYGQSPGSLRLTVIARDAAGTIVNLGTTYLAAPELEESVPLELQLAGEPAVDESLDWEFWVSEG